VNERPCGFVLNIEEVAWKLNDVSMLSLVAQQIERREHPHLGGLIPVRAETVKLDVAVLQADRIEIPRVIVEVPIGIRASDVVQEQLKRTLPNDVEAAKVERILPVFGLDDVAIVEESRQNAVRESIKAGHLCYERVLFHFHSRVLMYSHAKTEHGSEESRPEESKRIGSGLFVGDDHVVRDANQTEQGSEAGDQANNDHIAHGEAI
jgi:hypothetical protein